MRKLHKTTRKHTVESYLGEKTAATKENEQAKSSNRQAEGRQTPDA